MTLDLPTVHVLANGAANPVTQRIMADFTRKLTQLEAEYSKAFEVLYEAML